MVPESQETIGVVAQALAELPGDHLRLHRHVRAACPAPPSAATTPACRSAPSRGSSRCSLLLEQRQQCLQRRRGCRRPGRPRRDSAGRCAAGRDRSARRAPCPAWDRTRCTETSVPTISSVSHSSIASCEGSVPSRPMPPVVYGLSSGTAALPSSALTIGAPSVSASCSSSSPASSAPRPARMTIFFPRSGSSAARADPPRRAAAALRPWRVRDVMARLRCAASALRHFLLLEVDREM